MPWEHFIYEESCGRITGASRRRKLEIKRKTLTQTREIKRPIHLNYCAPNGRKKMVFLIVVIIDFQVAEQRQQHSTSECSKRQS
jgi:hypothetical protein